jgi:hypothetical protein
MYKKLVIVLFALSIISFSGCITEKEADIEDELSIEYFIVEPGLINIGESANLSWKVSDATSVIINNDIGNVGLEGKQIIFPIVNTTFTIIASNDEDEVYASTTIYVVEEIEENTPFLSMTKDLGTNNCIITIGTITENDVLWTKTDYTLLDIDTGNEIIFGITYPSSGTISGGDIITLTGLRELNKYRFTIIYKPTGGTMGTISWTQ